MQKTVQQKRQWKFRFKQQNLVAKIPYEVYDAHDASADVKSLYSLFGHLEYSEKDIFPFNQLAVMESFTPIIKTSCITKPKRLAICVLRKRQSELTAKLENKQEWFNNYIEIFFDCMHM